MARAVDERVYTNELLREALVPTAGQAILALGVAAEVVADWARAVGPTGRVVALERWLPDWRALLVEKQRGGAKMPLEALFAAELTGIGEQSFDICAIDISSFHSNRALLDTTHAAGERLKPDGMIYAAGPKDTGILSFTKRLVELFGNAQPMAYRKGQRVVVARKTGDLTPLPPDDRHGEVTITLRDHSFVIDRDPAVFAGGALDDATAMLIDALVIKPDDRVLDLGCGSGLLGLVAAQLAPEGQVVMTDADASALELARRNCTRNGITNAVVKEADVADTIAPERFTVVVCNPPFHQRHERNAELVQRFMRAAAERLDIGGHAYFVANRFLAYESKLGALFPIVTEVAGDARYKVLRGTKG